MLVFSVIPIPVKTTVNSIRAFEAGEDVYKRQEQDDGFS